ARDGHVAEVELGATETQRREPLLAFGTDVSGLGNRLGIVTARRPRIATRHSDVTDAPRLASGCEGHVHALEVPQRPMRPGIGGPPRPGLDRLLGRVGRCGARTTMVPTPPRLEIGG